MDENDMKKKFFFNTKSPAYRRALEDCERVAASNVNVLPYRGIRFRQGCGCPVYTCLQPPFRHAAHSGQL